jgi:hypothetical protein
MNGPDARAGKEGGHCLPRHREIDGNGVPFLDAERLEDIGNGGDLTKKLGKGDFAAFAWFIGLVDDSSLELSENKSLRCKKRECTLLGCLNAQRSTQL